VTRTGIEPDPNYRQASAYEYGDLRQITLHCILSQSILWSYEIESVTYGGKWVVGGFSGPFEALAAALRYGRENRQEVQS
jgi:hypothetical protein